MPNLSGFRATCKNRKEIGTYIRLSSTEPFNWRGRWKKGVQYGFLLVCQNLLKFCRQTLLMWKKVRATKLTKENTPRTRRQTRFRYTLWTTHPLVENCFYQGLWHVWFVIHLRHQCLNGLSTELCNCVMQNGTFHHTINTHEYYFTSSNWMAPGNNHVSTIPSEIFKYVRSTQTSQANLCHVKRCSCVIFFPQSREKRLPPPPPPPPPPPRIAPPSWKNAEFGYTRYGHPVLHSKKTAKILLTSFGGTEGGGLTFKSFLRAFREKQHRIIFSHNTGWLAKFGWILIYLKISLEMVLTWLLPGAIQFGPMNNEYDKR